MNLFKKNSRKSKGQALVEFALVMPVLLIYLLGAAEFSNMFMTALRVSNLSREAANIAFRDCSYYSIPLGTSTEERDEAQQRLLTCMNEARDRINAYTNSLLGNFNSKGTVILSLYNTADNISSVVKGGSAAANSRYSIGSFSSLQTNHPIIAAGEVFYQYTPLTPFANLIMGFSVLQNLYEVTIY